MNRPEFAPLPPDILGATTLGMAALDVATGTEADPAAVLVHLLAGVGAAAGPGVYADWSGRRTPARLYALVVGTTGAGKGHAEGIAMPLLEEAADSWAEEGVVTGLSSGEGLVRALTATAGEEDEEGGGAATASEGRSLLVVEPEFARVLAAGRREGSTLTHMLRDLWDRETAAVLTRSKPMRVKRAHLAIVGHVTPRELSRAVDENEIENGLLNRFVPVFVERGALRPFGPEVVDHSGAIAAVAAAVTHGRSTGRVALGPGAERLWAAMYRSYAAERPGLHGSLVARAIAHVQRLALIFAIGDRSHVVTETHLRAAEAVWHRADAAWRRLYGERLGDPMAERLLDAIREAPNGLSKSELKAKTGSGNTPTAKLDAALALLRDGGLVRSERRPTGGKPAEVWSAVSNGRNGLDGREAEPTPGLSTHTDHVDHAGSPIFGGVAR